MPKPPRFALRALPALVSCSLAACLAVASPQGGASPPAAATAAALPAVGLECPGTPVSVRAPDRAVAQSACEAASAATAFLSQMGLDVATTVVLAIVPKLPEGAGAGALGCYHRGERTAWVLVESACRNPGATFGLAMSPAVYRSVIVHELAHAIAGANFADRQASIIGQEYIAYVTQLATMPATLRDRILARYPRGSDETFLRLNIYIYMMDPAQFAAIAWRHHVGPGGGPDFIRAVIEGRALNDNG